MYVFLGFVTVWISFLSLSRVLFHFYIFLQYFLIHVDYCWIQNISTLLRYTFFDCFKYLPPQVGALYYLLGVLHHLPTYAHERNLITKFTRMFFPLEYWFYLDSILSGWSFHSDSDFIQNASFNRSRISFQANTCLITIIKAVFEGEVHWV